MTIAALTVRIWRMGTRHSLQNMGPPRICTVIATATGAVSIMRDHLRNPQIGVVVPQILDDEGSVFRSLRREPTIATAWTNSILGGSLAAHIGSHCRSEPLRAWWQSRVGDRGGFAHFSACQTARWRVGRVVLPLQRGGRLHAARAGMRLVVEYVPQARVIHIEGRHLG